MKPTILNQTIQPTGLTIQDFTTGLVFGFDLGTASLGYAVRRGSEFLDVGVIICPEDTSDLAQRRQFRSQRRRIRSQRNRKKWIHEQLAKMGLPKPGDLFFKPLKSETKESLLDRVNPVRLRCRAVKGDGLSPEQLHIVISHVLSRRGYLDNPPWGNEPGEEKPKDDEKEDDSPEAAARKKRKEEQEKLETALKESDAELATLPEGERFICFALKRRGDANKLTTSVRQRGVNWRRKYLAAEFAKLAEMQNLNRDEFRTRLGVEKPAEWLLNGSTACVDGHSVVFSKGKDAKAKKRHVPGAFSLHWPRFRNRSPGLDAATPQSVDGKPLHTMLRSKPLYREWQFLIAAYNLRVERVVVGGRKKKPKLEALRADELESLRTFWNQNPKVDREALDRWAVQYVDRFILREKQGGLTGGDDVAGRGRFSKLGLEKMIQTLEELHKAGKLPEALTPRSKREKKKSDEELLARWVREQTPPPSLVRMKDGAFAESFADARSRFIGEVRDPLVRHRLELFAGLVDQLVKQHSKDDGSVQAVVVEAVRSLAMNEDDKSAKEKADADRRMKNNAAAQALKDMGYPNTDDNRRKFLLADEVGWRCPFTGSPFLATEFDDLTITRIADAKWPHREKFLREAKAALPGLEVEHLTPKADLVCNEWFNLTVTTRKVNDLKAGRSPYKAFNEQQDPPWDALTKRAAERFGKESLKYRIFIHPNPAELIEERHSLQRTAYIARCARAVVLLTFGWVDETGHDPRLTPGNEASLRYHVSNGALTSRLRKAWHMDELLWDDLPFFDDAAFAAKSAEEKAHIKAEREARKRKNRLDQRHHAFDAMIVSCTIPWFAHRVSQVQGWNEYDPARGIERVFCPVFNDHGHGLHEAARLARDKMAKSATTDEVFKVEHHSPKKTHKAQFKTTLYGRRESFKGDELPQAVFVARDKLTNLVESNLSATKDDGTGNNGSYIFSPLLSKHIATAWADWKTKPENWSAVVADANRAAEARLAEVRANPKSKQTTIRAAESRVWNTQKFATMEPTPQSWTAILTWLDKERGTQQPKPCLPEQFVAGLQHPIYHTPLRSVKMTAQTKDEDAMLETRVDADPAKCSKTFVYFQGYRELRVYEGRRGKSVQYKGWLVRGYYRPGKRITEHTPSEFAKLPHVGTFKKDQVLKFLRDTKDIKADEAWIIRGIRKGIKVTLERAVHAREAKVLLPVASSSNGDGVTAARPGSRKASSYETITADTQVLGLEDLMLGLQPPETNELPHSPPTQL